MVELHSDYDYEQALQEQIGEGLEAALLKVAIHALALQCAMDA